MTTTRSIIVDNLSTTLTTEYTNSSNGNAVIKSINVNGKGNTEIINTLSDSAEQWNWFGSTVTPYNSPYNYTQSGFGVPHKLQLSSDRVLLIWMPHFMHVNNKIDFLDGGVLHTQILEYQSNKYVAGPIVNIELGQNIFTDSNKTLYSAPHNVTDTYSSVHFKSIALTPTTVVFSLKVSGYFNVYKMNIVGNKVDSSSLINRNLNSDFSLTAYDYDINHVPGNTAQFVIGSASNTNWKLAPYQVSNSSISLLSAAFDTGFAVVATSGFAMTNMQKTATANSVTYAAFCPTSSTSAQLRLYSYNSSTYAFGAVGSAVTVSSGSGAWAGVQAGCVSTGTNADCVIAASMEGVTNSIYLYRQTNANQASNSITAQPTLHVTKPRSLHETHQWGDERVVFVGESLLVTFANNGVATSIHNSSQTTSTDRWQQQWFPFNSRPIYNRVAAGTPIINWVPQWLSRVNVTSNTSVGVESQSSNYLPWGHDYGTHYQWSDKADCWMVGQYGKIYAISNTGVVLDEISTYNLSLNFPSATYPSTFEIKHLAVSKSGKIHIGAERLPEFIQYQWNSYSDGYVIPITTQPVLKAKDLNKTSAILNPTAINGFLGCSLVAFTDYYNVERAYYLYHYNTSTPDTYIGHFTDAIGSNAAVWTTGINTQIASTTVGDWNRGPNSNFRLIQDTPCTITHPEGFWRVYGPRGTQTAAYINSFYFSDAHTRAGSNGTTSFTSLTMSNLLSDNANFGYGIPYKRTTRTNVLASFDSTLYDTRVISSINGRINDVYGWYDKNTGSYQDFRYPNIAVTKFGYSVVFQQTSSNTKQTPRIYVFNTSNLYSQSITLSSNNSEYGSAVTLATGRTSWSIHTANVSVVYNCTGEDDPAKISVALANSSGNTFYISNQQEVNANSLYRASDTYVVAPGMSLKMKTDTPYSLTGLITVIEEI